MALLPCKCTQCGAKLDVESNQEAAVCPFCNTPFIVEKAINNYNISVSQMHADVVNVVNDGIDSKLRSAEAYLRMRDYDAACNAFDQIARKHAYDYRGWVGFAKSISKNYTYTDAGVVSEVRNCYQRATTVADDEDKETFEKGFRDYFALVNRRQGIIDNECRAVDEETKKKVQSIKNELKQASDSLTLFEKKKKQKDAITIILSLIVLICAIFTVVSCGQCACSSTPENEGDYLTRMIVGAVVGVIVFIVVFCLFCSEKNEKMIQSQKAVIAEINNRIDDQKSQAESEKASIAIHYTTHD